MEKWNGKCVRKYKVLLKKENRFTLIRVDLVILIINTPNNRDLNEDREVKTERTKEK